MRQPLLTKVTTRQRVSMSFKLPAPVRGWYSRESVMDAPEGSALILENFFPEATNVRVRGGYRDHSTGLSGTVETLMPYTSFTNSKLFAASGTSVYDVTSSGAVGAAVITGLNNARWQHCMFSTLGGQYLVMCNGIDAVRNFDGTTWTTPSITVSPSTSANFIDVTAFKEYLWFVDEGTTDLYYLTTVRAVTGGTTRFPIGSFMRKGGHILSISTWTIDGGDGMDDRLVVATSEGEVFIYAGSPATSMALVGRFVISKPIGRRCMYNVGGDVAIITESGIVALSGAISVDEAQAAKSALTDPIRQSWHEAVVNSAANFGWEIVTYPSKSMALVNIPGANAQATKQYAFNTVTGAWACFSNMGASCWAYFNNAIYFGQATKVSQAEYGAADGAAAGAGGGGSAISCTMLPAYNDLSAPGVMKQVKMVRPIYTSEQPGLTPLISIGVDYELPSVTNPSQNTASVFGIWDTSRWDASTAIWFGTQLVRGWQGNGNIGIVVSPYLFLNITSATAGTNVVWKLITFDVLYEKGAPLG